MKNLLPVILLFILFACADKKEIHCHFEELKTGSEASLRGLYVVDENTVWASGSGGTVLLTTDAGNIWHEINVPNSQHNEFRSIHAWDDKRAIVFGVAGPDFGYLTENGGENWEIVYLDTTSGLFFNSLKFADDFNGLAVSDPVDGKFFVIRTEDGGKSWSRTELVPPVEEGEANFAASNTCIEYLPSGDAWFASGGKAARIFYSNDFGLSWEVAKTPMLRGTASSGIFSVAFQNSRQGIVVGGIYDQPEINTNIAAYTNDGGKTWAPSANMPRQYRSCIQYITISENPIAIAIGKTGCDYSIDNGINWQTLSDEGYYTIRTVPAKAIAYVARNEGRVARITF